MSLSKVRKLLEYYKDIYMGENMKFLKIINDVEAQINVEEEEYIKVSKIFVKRKIAFISAKAQQSQVFSNSSINILFFVGAILHLTIWK